MRRRSIGPIGAILSAALIAFLVKAFVLDAAVVEGRSMLPLFSSGSVVLVLRCAYGLRLPFSGRYIIRWAQPRRGDVVAASSPRDGRAVVKRVAAVGPSRLSIVAGRILGPGIDLPLAPEAAERFGERVVLGLRDLFLLGDNPRDSIDSREYGPITIEAVAGRVISFP